MNRTRCKSVWLHGLFAGVTALAAAPASAGDLEIGDFFEMTIDNLFTVGGAVRTQDFDINTISKSTAHRILNGYDVPALCVGRDGDDGTSGPDTSGANTYNGDTCTTSDLAANEAFVAAPGAFSPNADDGNANFDKGDFVAGAAKLLTDYSADVGPFSFFARTLWYFDETYVDFDERNFDTTLEQPSTPLSREAREVHGADLRLLDAYVSGFLPFFGDRELSVKVGKQVLNWGESSLLLLNSLNSINPVSQPRLVTPGFDLKELVQPVGMVYAQTDITFDASVELFYQYEWEPLETNAVGHFNSPSDILGAGGDYAMLSFGKAPEDPLGLYQPNQNPDDPIGLLDSEASRTIYRNRARERQRAPDDGGQYGAALKMFLADFNGGTELAFYYANYHARVPSVSAIAAQETCIPADQGNAGANLIALVAQPDANGKGCGGGFDPATGTITTDGEPVPVDTAQLVVDYPEDIQMYGMSFNTLVGDWAMSGEYAFRTNLPIQVHSTDLIFAALQPAFPEEDYDIGAAVIPGRRSAVPDFITGYRGGTPGDIDAGQFIRGWEPMKIGQANLTFLKTIGGDNPIGAAQIVLLLEHGYTHVLDYPSLSELQFNGASTNTHISHGGDGTVGIEPPDTRGEDPGSDDERMLRQNPTSENQGKFGTKDSYGIRYINLNRYDNVIFGANLETLFIARWDIEGRGPGVGQNFSEGRKQFDFGVRWDYLSRFIGELRYTWFTGAKGSNTARDKDQVSLYAGWQF